MVLSVMPFSPRSATLPRIPAWRVGARRTRTLAAPSGGPANSS
jgi:hypothetical protein